jgi:putative protease
MTVHNSIGVQIARTIGLSRIVLARELTIEEIITISKKAALELEVFIHGALCYSISGLCLASSFIGGASGNRGRCTQVCRRKFLTGRSSGYYYSPDDFCAADFLLNYCKASISSLKIEGRMKNAEYVATVVSTYRQLLDNSITSDEAREKLDRDWGRPKTSLFLDGTHTRGHINASRPSGTGQFLGTITHCEDDRISIESECDLSVGDRLRIHPQSGFEGTPAVIKSVIRSGSSLQIHLKNPVNCTTGDTVYRIGTRQAGTPSHKVTTPEHININLFYKNSRSIMAAVTIKQHEQHQEKMKLWCKVDTIDWLPLLSASPCRFLLCAPDISDLSALLSNQTMLRIWRSRLIPCLPPFIAENQITEWKSLISDFKKEGITRWVCSNIGHTALFTKEFSLIADYTIPVLNSASWIALKKLGFSMFMYSPEDEYCNLKRFVSPEGILYLYAHVPLFISRIRPAAPLQTTVSDPCNNQFFTYCSNEVYYTSSVKKLCLIGKKAKIEQIGIINGLIDFSQIPADQTTLDTVITSYKAGVSIPGTSLFNFKAGLK